MSSWATTVSQRRTLRRRAGSSTPSPRSCSASSCTLSQARPHDGQRRPPGSGRAGHLRPPTATHGLPGSYSLPTARGALAPALIHGGPLGSGASRV
eukprot:scaffold49759_cov44-Phaeocystis_antarctica.AAC.2